MWIFLNDSFLSIVTHPDKPGVLLVRARKTGDIEAVFPDAMVRRTPDHDYLFRAEMPADRVGRVLADRVRRIDYPNFKDSVGNSARRSAYTQVWDTMRRWGRINGRGAAG